MLDSEEQSVKCCCLNYQESQRCTMKFFKIRRTPLQTGLILCFLLGIWDEVDLFAYVAEALQSDYSVFSHGVRVGEYRSVCSIVPHKEKKALKYEANTHIHANLLVYAYDLDTKEEA